MTASGLTRVGHGLGALMPSSSRGERGGPPSRTFVVPLSSNAVAREERTSQEPRRMFTAGLETLRGTPLVLAKRRLCN